MANPTDNRAWLRLFTKQPTTPDVVTMIDDLRRVEELPGDKFKRRVTESIINLHRDNFTSIIPRKPPQPEYFQGVPVKVDPRIPDGEMRVITLDRITIVRGFK